MTRLWHWMTESVRRRRLDRESAEELALHVEMLVEEKCRTGLSDAEARRQARLALGSVETARRQLADARGGSWLEQTSRELGYAARVLWRTRGFTALAVTTLATGLGASALLFALVSSIVLRPLPYPAPDGLVRIFDSNPAQGIERAGVASGNLIDWRRRASRFEGIAAYYVIGRTISGAGDAAVVLTAQVTQDFFPVLGIAPAVGSTFSEDDISRAEFDSAAAPVGADPVVVIAHSLWQQRFGGDPAVIGRTLILERQSFRVIAVMPQTFAMPERGVQLWMPWGLSDDQPRDQHYLSAVGRLTPGATIAEAESDLNRVAGELAREHPVSNRGWGVRVSSLHAETVGGLARVLWILLAAVGLVLVVACSSVALLSLMRGLDRSDEIAVRLALGASTGRLFRELLMESALVAVTGGVVGLLGALTGLHLLPRLVPDLPRIDEVGLDGSATLFIVVATSAAAVVSGWPLAWRQVRRRSFANITGGALRSTPMAERHGLRNLIVVGQVALAAVLLVGSGLLVRSFVGLRAADPGFTARGVLVLPIFLDTREYGTGSRIRGYYDRLFERLGALPTVLAVGGATSLPTSPLGPDFDRPVWPAAAADDPAQRVPASVRIVTPGYFEALQLALAGGRRFDTRDRADTAPVLMVSETLARRLWPDKAAVGQRLVVDYSTAGTYAYDVIGVVKDVRFHGPRSAPLPEIYLAHAQRSYLILNVAVRTSGDPRAIVAAARGILNDLDPQKPAHGVYLLEDLLEATIIRDRQAMTALLIFAGAAVFLAVLSVYGVLAQRVRERSRDIGIRMAMGASGSQVVGWVAQSGLRMIAVGIAVGLTASWALAGTLSGLLFEVQPVDPLTGVLAIAVLGTVGLVATLIPAWRATRIDPVVVLRRG